jgi:hypothetical protein
MAEHLDRPAAAQRTSIAARLGNVPYWIANGLAVIVLLFGIWASIAFQDTGIIAVLVFGIYALIIWAVGRACLYVLAGR